MNLPSMNSFQLKGFLRKRMVSIEISRFCQNECLKILASMYDFKGEHLFFFSTSLFLIIYILSISINAIKIAIIQKPINVLTSILLYRTQAIHQRFLIYFKKHLKNMLKLT